ncbi:Ig-like domain-containing protein [Synechococcus sp. PCC 7336]|uniref:Ig-like domain-containing protein n=1 Tax=Synechococcus sp. PCC 7336 TaxID=195250 RepID=UPI00034A450A|nr:Ig-like domain-containing protein [Synechococcus sp. PCC 7336]
MNDSSFFFSLNSKTTVNGSTFEDEDIIFFDGQSFSTFFDGSDLGLDGLEIDAFDVISNTEILLSFTTETTIDGIAIDDSDLVKFTASQLGNTTEGSFELFFDASDVGLTASSEDVDGVQMLEDGSLLISTVSRATVPGGVEVRDEDVLRFAPASLGSNTSGVWSIYVDGSDLGLDTSSSEDVTAIALDDAGNLHLSTLGSFSVPGVSGADEDVVVFTPSSTGPVTAGSFQPDLFFDGSLLGISGDIRGLDLAIGFGGGSGGESEPVNSSPVASDDSFILDAGTTFTASAPGVLANDSDADGDPLAVNLLGGVSNGSLVFNSDGSFSYTPDVGFSGADSFSYAVSDGLASDSATVELVVNAPVTSEFNIEFVFTDGNLTPSQQAIFDGAASRWEEIITGDIPDVFVSGIGLVDDLAIEVSTPFIDGVGSILGQAGPTSLRSGSFLPAAGIVQFDAADVSNLEANGQLDEVVLHEIGHVLGIGTIWEFTGLLVGGGSADPRFVGQQATAEYNSIFGLNESSVPVENTGGPGTRDSHWRESIFDNELLTGFLDSGRPNPLSRITVGSLADLGYSVNLAAADPYLPPSLVAGAQFDAALTDREAAFAARGARFAARESAFAARGAAVSGPPSIEEEFLPATASPAQIIPLTDIELTFV